MRLRVKDLDFAQHQILVRDGKGEKDRVTMLPESLVSPLQDYLRIVKRTHEEDLAKGYSAVYLPYALERCASIPERSGVDKYPNAEREWIRLAPTGLAVRLSCQSPFGRPARDVVRRLHIHESSLQKAVRAAAQATGIPKRVSPHIFRQCEASL